jgi:predicted ATPase
LPLVEPDACIGREREIAEIAGVAGRSRLITLTGPGGVGKTRLLSAVTAALSGLYPDGACLARLTDLREPDLVAAALAKATGICEEAGVPIADTLAEALSCRTMLLALDGCDAVAGGCAILCERLLAAAPGLLILATSRDPLGGAAETSWPVPPLAVPAARPHAARASVREPGAPGASRPPPRLCGAMLLFAVRAGDVAVTAAGLTAARSICLRLGGMPLAIELAAARARQLGVAPVRAGLDKAVAAAAPAGPAAVTRAAIAWTAGLLTPAGQVLLRRLSVFASWSVEMAEQVCYDDQLPPAQVSGLLAGLAEAGLVEIGLAEVSAGMAAPDRYRLPGAVRDYAAGRLAEAGEADKLGRRLREHVGQRAAYLLSIGVRVPASWPVLVQVQRSYEADISNIRAALAWWRDHGDAAAGLDVCAEMVNYWIAVGTLGEGAWWLDAFLDPRRPVVPGGDRGPALVARSLLAYDGGDQQGAEKDAAAGLRLCQAAGNERRAAAALDMLSRTALNAGRAEEALHYAVQAIEVCHRSGDNWNHGFALGSKAYALAALGRVDEAMAAAADGLELMRSISNQWGAALFQVGIGDVARALGDHAGARGYYLAALPFMRDAMPAPHPADCLARIGSADIRLGDLAEARDHLSEGLRLAIGAGHRRVMARCLLSLATLAVREGRPDRAVTLAAAATAQCQAARLPPPPPDRLQRYHAAAASLGEPEISRLEAAGLAMTSRAAADYALTAS